MIVHVTGRPRLRLLEDRRGRETYEVRLGGRAYSARRFRSPWRAYDPVLLLGGAFQSMDSLERFARTFARRTDVYVVDPPGTGASDPLPARHGASSMAECVARAVGALGARSVHVIGVSFGTAVAHELARAHPEGVSSLVLLGTMSEVDERLARALGACDTALAEGGRRAFADLACRVLLNHRARADIEDFDRAEKIVRVSAARLSDRALEHFRANARRLLAHRRLGSGPAPPVPALVFTGEHDRVTTPEHCRAVAATFARARCTTVARADHLVALERPRACTELVEGFFRSLRASGARPARDLGASGTRRSPAAPAFREARNRFGVR